jgi:MFS family permease
VSTRADVAAPRVEAGRPTRPTQGPAPERVSYAAVFRPPYLGTTVTILAGTAISSMDSYIVNTSMPRVLGELGQPEFYAWVPSAFILAQVVGLSVGGAWKDRSGLRTPFIVAVAAFGVGSVLCAMAPSMGLLVLARAVQGLAGGGLGAVCFAAAAAHREGVRLRLFSLISGAWGVFALGAPLLGGFITDTLGWRWIFLVNVPICTLVLLLGAFTFRASAPADAGRALPVVRAALLAVAVGSLTAAPSARMPMTLVLLGVGVAVAWVYARQERRAAVPIVPPGAWIGRGPVGSSMQAAMFYLAAYTGAGVFLPLYLVGVRGETSAQAGLVLSIGGFMWTIGSLVASSFGRGRWPMRMVVGGAVLIAVAGVSIAAQAAIGSLPLVLLYVTWGAAGLGVGLALLHLMNWAIVFSPARQSGSTSGGVQTMRMLGSAAGGALMGALLNALGADPEHLRLSITAIFLVVPVLALWPATIGRPKVVERSP